MPAHISPTGIDQVDLAGAARHGCAMICNTENPLPTLNIDKIRPNPHWKNYLYCEVTDFISSSERRVKPPSSHLLLPSFKAKVDKKAQRLHINGKQ